MLTRDFTVATFVVWKGAVLLLWHRKLQMWLPPGGHIEPNELPDEAAVREVREETGVEVELVGERGVPVADPLQLVRPAGIQLENIRPDHQHVDLIYFARPARSDAVTLVESAECENAGWYALDQFGQLRVNEEVSCWAARAVQAVEQPPRL